MTDRGRWVDEKRRALLAGGAAAAFTGLTGCGGGSDQAAAPPPPAGNSPGGGGSVPPPAASPVPAPAPAVVVPPGGYEPPITNEPQAEQYVTWDAGSGPTPTYWSRHLLVPWTNPGTGDFVDANGVAQGTSAFASVAVPTAGQYYALDVKSLVSRWLSNGNRGAYLKCSGGGPAVFFDGRTGAKPPVLEVATSAGLVTCPCTSSANWFASSLNPPDSRSSVQIDDASNFSIVRFDLSGLAATVTSATLRLFVSQRYGTNTSVQAFEANPPRFQLGAGDMTPEAGLAASVGEANLVGHPDVYMAGDFAGTTFSGDVARIPKLFGTTEAPAVNSPQVLNDPDAPGTVCWRGSFTANAGETRQSFNGTKTLMVADTANPLRPPKNLVEEAYYRMYVLLEDDWLSTRDGNKLGITWDLRMGYWVDGAPGYWQSVSGNGGAPGNGKRTEQFIASQNVSRYVYEGHMLRMTINANVADGNPYGTMQPFNGYNYHIDQVGPFPGSFAYRNLVEAKFRKGRWYCIEQRIRMNSIAGPYDADGNGTPNFDGILETWVDGVKVDSRTNYRWRCHPQMGVAAVNANWFYGGQDPTEVTQHYRMNHLVVARRYIGPRVKP